MHYKVVLKMTGYLWFVLSLILIGFILTLYFLSTHNSLNKDLFYFYSKTKIYTASIFTVGFLFLSLLMIFIKTSEFQKSTPKEALSVVCIGWLSMVFIGSIPYWAYALEKISFVNAIFESASGFSTTGATIFTNIESLPKTLLFWRSLTQWIGGMGIIVFFISIIPTLGLAGKNLYRSEAPGASKESMTPHIRDTGRTLWIIYFVLTIVFFVILLLMKMTPFDAICHALTSISTGGFSTKNNSFIEYSKEIQWVVSLFMIMGGINFGLYLSIFYIRGKLKEKLKIIVKNTELRGYLIVIITMSLLIFFILSISDRSNIERNLRNSFFIVTSITTTTGFINSDYEIFPMMIQSIILVLMFIGGCSGSTSGGIKLYRIITAYRSMSSEIKRLLRQDLITATKISGHLISESFIQRVFIFCFVYILTIGIGTLILFNIEYNQNQIDFLSCFSAVTSFVSNVGPALNQFGPTDNFFQLKSSSKILCSFLMIMGRLEFFTFLAIFHPAFWKK